MRGRIADRRWRIADHKVPPFYIVLVALAGALLLCASTVAATGDTPAAGSRPLAGNYCLECHVTIPNTTLSPLRPIEWARDIPCDTLRKAYEEVYQVDTLVAAAQNAAQQLQSQGFAASLQMKRLDARRVTAARLYEGEFVSLAALSNQGKTVRYQMNKTYAALQELRAYRQRLIVLGVAAAGSLFVLVSIFLGWRHTRKGRGKPKGSHLPLLWTVLACLVVFLLFATPLFGFAPPLPTATEEEMERQAAVDQANRVSDAANRLSAQVWVLGDIGAAWSKIDKAQGEAALTAALQAAKDKEANLMAYWGQVQAVRESAAAWRPSTLDLAVYHADRIEVAANQAWHLRSLAATWLTVDKSKAAELLQGALIQARRNPNAYYRDLDTRAVAVVWARLDPAKGSALMEQVADPFLRAWGFREMGLYDQAAQAARQVQDPYRRAWALRQIALQEIAGAPSGTRAAALLTEALEAANKVGGQETKAYVLADLAVAWASADIVRGREVVNSIDVSYPEARVLALHGVAVALSRVNEVAQAKETFREALSQIAKVDEPYKRAKLVAAIVPDYARVDAAAALEEAGKIPDAFFRDQAYADIAKILAPADRAQAIARIVSPAMQVKALSATAVAWLKVGDKSRAAATCQEAFALADRVEDTYYLRDLAVAWAAVDPQAALPVVDKITDGADKAVALKAIAVQSKDPTIFERAMAVAKSVRVRGEPFAAARALADLATAYATVDAAKAKEAFALALEAAKKVSVKY